ncbi:MAG: efflux RND transporter permease subunit [Terrimicrobiaceae bacterium]|nr:efflux RND transporter permease subunit [Terrimicrobiaceae bacterium]
MTEAPGAWAFGHRRSLLFLLVLLAVAGTASLWRLPVSLFPEVSFPRVRVSLDAGERPAERMLREVTIPAEEALRAIPGVRGVRSTTSRGSAEISVNFDWGHDMTAATLQVQAALSTLLPSLPAGSTFEVERMDPTVFPVIAYSLSSPNHSPVELRDLALYTLRPALTTVPGVAKVGVAGGETEEYRVVIHPGKLESLGLTISDVAGALSASNIQVAVGRIAENHRLYLVISDTRFRSLDEIPRTVIRSTPGGVVLLEDVAEVQPASEPQWTRVTADGRGAVLFQIYQQPGGNTVQIAGDVKRKLRELKAQIPPGVTLADWYDQSELITASASSARDCVLLGVVLAALTLFVFLRDWRVTLIAAIIVPAVLAATLLLLFTLRMSLNIMTLGGMAAAVGLIIDDAIVMIEQIVRRVRANAGENFAATVQGAAAEFTRPLLASSAATIVIFAPLAFLTGVTGAFFRALSLTMAAGLGLSFLIAWLVVPILSVRFLRSDKHVMDEAGGLARFMDRAYRGVMGRFLPVPALCLFLVLPLLAAGWLGWRNGATGFMPAMDEGGFVLDYLSAPGTSLEETDAMLRKVEAILQATPEVRTYSRRTGLQLGGGITEANTGDFFVRLNPQPRRPIEAVLDEVRGKVQRSVPGLQIETLQLMEDLIGDLTSVPQPIEVKLFASEETVLEQTAAKVAHAIGGVPGVFEVNNGIIPAGDALNIEVDRVKAAMEGMQPEAVTGSVEDLLSGKVTTTIQRGPKLIGVRVGIPPRDRQTEADVGRFLLHAPDGHTFPLKRVATLSVVSGQPEITREDLQRMVAVTGRIVGRDLGSTVAQVRRTLDAPGLLPPGVTYTLGGLYEQQQIAFHGLTIVMSVAAALVFLLLLYLYESFRVAGAMLFVALLAVAGVYFGLWVTGTEFNITSRMGMTMIIGIVTEVSIFYVSEFRSLPPSPGRFVQAGLNRMRPIAMTTFAAIFALAPLAFGIGEGSAMLQPLAIAIIAGLIFQLPLVLILLPILLSAAGVGVAVRADASD